jgi:hypothetical protein
MAEVTTIQARCRTASDFVKRYYSSPTGYWVAIGKTSAWPDDNSPPYPPPSVNQIPEILGFWYVHTCALVYPDASGLIYTASGRFTSIDYQSSYNSLVSAKANTVFLETVIRSTNITPGSSYRIRALCSDLNIVGINLPNLGPGVFVAPANVTSYFVERISVHSPVTFTGNSDHVIQMIREY